MICFWQSCYECIYMWISGSIVTASVTIKIMKRIHIHMHSISICALFVHHSNTHAQYTFMHSGCVTCCYCSSSSSDCYYWCCCRRCCRHHRYCMRQRQSLFIRCHENIYSVRRSVCHYFPYNFDYILLQFTTMFIFTLMLLCFIPHRTQSTRPYINSYAYSLCELLTRAISPYHMLSHSIRLAARIVSFTFSTSHF